MRCRIEIKLECQGIPYYPCSTHVWVMAEYDFVDAQGLQVANLQFDRPVGWEIDPLHRDPYKDVRCPSCQKARVEQVEKFKNFRVKRTV